MQCAAQCKMGTLQLDPPTASDTAPKHSIAAFTRLLQVRGQMTQMQFVIRSLAFLRSKPNRSFPGKTSETKR